MHESQISQTVGIEFTLSGDQVNHIKQEAVQTNSHEAYEGQLNQFSQQQN